MLPAISVFVIFGNRIIAAGGLAYTAFQVRIRYSALVTTIFFARTVPFQKLIAAIWMSAFYHS